MRARIAVLVLVVAVAFPAGAAAQLPVGEADGVRIVRERGAIVVVFSRSATRLWRQVAGRQVSVFCTEFSRESDGPFTSVDVGGSTMRAPRRGRRIPTGDQTRGPDYCRVWLSARRVRGARHGRRLIVSIPLSQTGALRLDEESKTDALRRVLFLAALEARRRGTTGYPLPAQLIASVRGRDRLVALQGPADSPPPGALGYYGDGGQHAVAAVLSATGRRLFIEYEPGGVLRTNVAEFLFD
jgi:hypothetical protein